MARRKNSDSSELNEEDYTDLQRAEDAQCLRMRLAGMNFPEIAKAMGYAGRSGAWTAVEREFKRSHQEPADELRTLEIMRLDRVLSRLWEVILYKYSGEGEPLYTFADVDKAANRVLQVSRRRSELLGLDAPKKIDITTQIREMAIAEGLDPDQAVRDAESIIQQNGG